MTFAVWRLSATVVGGLLGVIFCLGGAIVEGVVTMGVVGLWFTNHAVVSETLGARYLHRKAEVLFVKGAIVTVLVLASLAAMFVGFLQGWNRHPEGPILFGALAGVMVLLMRELERGYVQFEHLMDGGDAEIRVSNALVSLGNGWHVEDNWLRPDRRGNVDHIVGRPDGEWFAIETKSHRFRHGDASQAVGCAVAVRTARHLRWVTPVLCVDDRDQPPARRRVGRADVWVVDHRQLASWLPDASSTRD